LDIYIDHSLYYIKFNLIKCIINGSVVDRCLQFRLITVRIIQNHQILILLLLLLFLPFIFLDCLDGVFVFVLADVASCGSAGVVLKLFFASVDLIDELLALHVSSENQANLVQLFFSFLVRRVLDEFLVASNINTRVFTFMNQHFVNFIARYAQEDVKHLHAVLVVVVEFDFSVIKIFQQCRALLILITSFQQAVVYAEGVVQLFVLF